MSNFFIADGSITTVGYIILAILAFAAIVVAGLLTDKKKNSKLTTKQLVICAISLALAFITSYIKYEFPFGGSITLFSMFFICFVAYLYGPKTGLLVAFSYSILQFIQNGATYVLSPFQVCCDYFFAFTALGFAGFFKNKKNGLIIGYLISVFIRGLFHTLGGYLYWMEYMPEEFPKALAWAYPIIYNYSYLIPEAVITVIVLLVPAVKAAIKRCTALATE